MNRIISIPVTAIAIVTTFTLFSCSSHDDSGGGNAGATIFCKTDEACVEMSAETCLGFGGRPVNSCEANLPSSSSAGGVGSLLTDSRDNKHYRTVLIGTQTWMAENLNYDVPNNDTDVCHDNDSDYCTRYGRFYSWPAAMALDPSCNEHACAILTQTPHRHRGICPAGWHLPSDEEWNILVKYIDPKMGDDGYNNAGTKLKTTSGWDNCSFSLINLDTYGFSALPAGSVVLNDNWYNLNINSIIGSYGEWWSASGTIIEYAYLLPSYWSISCSASDLRNQLDDGVNQFTLRSVRCVQD